MMSSEEHASYMTLILCLCLWSLFSVDATKHISRMGRYINDGNSTSSNSKMKMVVFHGRPHLCCFAVKSISAGEEIRYDYCDDSAWWRQVR